MKKVKKVKTKYKSEIVLPKPDMGKPPKRINPKGDPRPRAKPKPNPKPKPKKKRVMKRRK